jgi:hypothetical protein
MQIAKIRLKLRPYYGSVDLPLQNGIGKVEKIVQAIISLEGLTILNSHEARE